MRCKKSKKSKISKTSKKPVMLLLISVFAMIAMLVPVISGGGRTVYAASDFDITDGVLTNYKGTGGAVTIPSGKVTAIADQAFYGCGSITSLTIPQGVKTIGKQAFTNCSGMTSVAIPASVTSIGELCFDGCSKLQTITVSSGSADFSSDGGVLFNDDKTVLIRYPEGKSATSYTVPSSVTIIGKSAFSRCLSLTRVALPSSLKLIRDNAFYEDINIISLTIPSTVTSIGSNAFRSTGGLKTLTLEAKKPSFGSYAFKNTGIIRILYAGDTTQWADANMSDVFGSSAKVYYNMTGFQVEDDVLVSYTGSAESVSVPGFIVRIDDKAFRDRNSMKSITLPTSLQYIDQSAFDGCTSLARITIPSSVISIEKWAFDNCTSLARISVATDNKNYSASGGVLYNKNKSVLLRCPPAIEGDSFTVPSTVTKIGDSAFSVCKGLKHVTLPDGVETIDHYAFDQCAVLTDLTVPASVTTVGKYAFRSNKKLTSVTLNALSPSFGTGAFENSPVAKVVYAGSQAQWNAAGLSDVFGSSVNVYYGTSDFEIDGTTLTAYKGSNEKVTVPDYITCIGAGAFKGCDTVKSITIPNSVTAIGESAFANCSALTGIAIPASVTAIDKWAFDGCSKLSSISVASANASFSASDGVLYNKDKSKLLRYPPNKSGSSYTFPGSVRTIGDSAVASCQNLTRISLTSGVQTIEQYAFDQCANLASLTIPSTVTSVGRYAFRSNYKLKTVVILAKSPSVSSNAFLADSVATVCFAGSDSQWNSSGLSGVFDSEPTVYCNYSYPAITKQPVSTNATVGRSITLSVGANGCGLKYQWYFKKAAQSGWNTWLNHKSASEQATPNDTWDGIQLYCEIRDAAGIIVNSSVAKITLVSGAAITQQPKSATVEKGSAATLSLKATGEGLKYQWYFKKKGQTSFNLWNGRTHASETVTPNDTWDGIQLYCLVRDSYGNSLKSDVITITLKEPLAITQQPQSRTIKKGSSMTISVKATGSGLKYQWYFRKQGQTSWSVWNGRTGATETVTPNDTWDGIQLYCLVRDFTGASVKSNAAKIRFGTPLAITAQPQSKTVTLGNAITLSFKAQGTGLKYQWYFKKKGQTSWSVWNGRTGATETVTPNATWDGIQLYCLITDGAGARVKTNTITVTVR